MRTRYLRLLNSWLTDISTVHVYSRQYEIIFDIIRELSSGEWCDVYICYDRSCLSWSQICDWHRHSLDTAADREMQLKCEMSSCDEDNYADYSGDDIWPQLPRVMSPYTGDEYRRLTSPWPFTRHPRLMIVIAQPHQLTQVQPGISK